MNSVNDEIYNAYFGKKDTNVQVTPDNPDKKIYRSVKDNRIHLSETVKGVEYEVSTLRLMADDNIDELEQFANIIKKLCNAAWGENWGEFSPDLKKGEDTSKLVLPQITCQINSREIDESLSGPKPRLTDIISETDEEGNLTGDAFLIYRQWYATNVEFNIYGRTSKEARELKHRFERLITVYTGYLKRHGISEMWFESESPSKCSLNYDESAFMCCIYYFIRFESILPVRQSTINRINAEIGINKLNTDRIRMLIETNQIDSLDLDFFDGDNGITLDEN